MNKTIQPNINDIKANIDLSNGDDQVDPPVSSISRINDDVKGKLNIENLKNDFIKTEDQSPGSTEDKIGEPLSDIQLQQEQFGNGVVDDGQPVTLEEIEEDFSIKNVGPHEGGSNAVLPGETKEEYNERKAENKVVETNKNVEKEDFFYLYIFEVDYQRQF